MTSTDLGNKCSKTFSWIPLTKVKSFLLNSALLEIRIPALVLNCSYASSVLNKIRNPLTFCRIHLQLWNPKQLARFACCGIRNLTNVPKKIYVTLICTGSFVSDIHLLFGTCLKISFWDPGTYRHKIVRLSSAQLGLVMTLN